MRRMTGSQRKAKRKQRSMSRTPKGKRQSGYTKLYHATSLAEAHSIRHTGLSRVNTPTTTLGLSGKYSPFAIKPGGKRIYVHNTLTGDKRYAADIFGKPIYKKKNKLMGSNRKRSKMSPWDRHSRNSFARMGTNKKSVIMVRIPRKKANEYLLHGFSESSAYESGRVGAKKQANNYGIRKRVPSKYIR